MPLTTSFTAFVNGTAATPAAFNSRLQELIDNATGLSGDLTIGGTLGVTGAVTVSGGTITVQHASTAAGVAIESVSGTGKELIFRDETTGNARWFTRSNVDAESGSNAGSNFEILARADDGTAIGTALSIIRASMAATFGAGLTITGDLLPSANSTHDVGADATRWANGYFDALDATIATIGEGTVTGALAVAGDCLFANNVTVVDNLTMSANLNHDGSGVGFYGTAPIAQQTGVAVTAEAIHDALVDLGLITA